MRKFSRSQLLAVSFWILAEQGLLLEFDGLVIRQAKADHIPAIMRLERSSNDAAHWSEQQYQSLIEANTGEISTLALVAECEPKSTIVAFLIARQIGPDWELENIVVDQEMRGRGIGTRLLNRLLDRAQQANSDAVFLEVRESNHAARALYRKLGFEQIGSRKSYYSNPLEDAILYRKILRGHSG
jgi:[ribosomal protein S18]-alanine N-acetyltransferase